MIGVKIYNVDLYDEFIYGENYKPLLDIFVTLNTTSFNDLLNANETYSNSCDEQQIHVTLEKKVKELYNAIFVKQYTSNDYFTTVGRYTFDEGTKELLLRVSGLLSDYTYLEDD